jgi:hypothetical protein
MVGYELLAEAQPEPCRFKKPVFDVIENSGLITPVKFYSAAELELAVAFITRRA